MTKEETFDGLAKHLSEIQEALYPEMTCSVSVLIEPLAVGIGMALVCAVLAAIMFRFAR